MTAFTNVLKNHLKNRLLNDSLNGVNSGVMQSSPVGQWISRAGVAMLMGLGLVTAATVQHPALSNDIPSSEQSPLAIASETVSSSPLPDGIYLYGQAEEPAQIGSAYLVFEVNQERVVGAFYMPHSSFDCFEGGFENNQLALTVIDSYEQTRHPYALALDTSAAVASEDGSGGLPGLEGYHRIATVSDNDLRILGVCQSDLQ
jgi:hypothetical protein